MSDIFPKWTNRLPLYIIIGALLIGTGVTAGVWYYFTPKYTRVGYEPIQPVGFPHSVHVDQLGLDCRYCHSAVERSWYSNVPSANTCMNCHNQVLKDDPRLALVRESATSGKPIPWVQVHRVPDFVYFNHSIHVNRGISCVECHGKINEMDVVTHMQPLSMEFCITCHRNPEARLRDPKDVFNLDSKRLADMGEAGAKKAEKFVHDWKVKPPQSCSGC